MRKQICLLMMIILLAGCAQRQSQQDNVDDDPSAASAPDAVEAPEDADDREEESEAPDIDSQEVETDTVVEQWPDDLSDKILEVVLQYEENRVATNDRFQPVPDDFVFSKARDMTCMYSPVMGDYRVTLLSNDGKWEMIMVANNFQYQTEDGLIGGDFVVTDVIFMER